MFTIKYRTYRFAPQQPTLGEPCYCTHEQILGPFEFVSQEVDDKTSQFVVHAYAPGGSSTTLGPVQRPDEGQQNPPPPIIWVMNETGATVARYDL